MGQVQVRCYRAVLQQQEGKKGLAQQEQNAKQSRGPGSQVHVVPRLLCFQIPKLSNLTGKRDFYRLAQKLNHQHLNNNSLLKNNSSYCYRIKPTKIWCPLLYSTAPFFSDFTQVTIESSWCLLSSPAPQKTHLKDTPFGKCSEVQLEYIIYFPKVGFIFIMNFQLFGYVKSQDYEISACLLNSKQLY